MQLTKTAVIIATVTAATALQLLSRHQPSGSQAARRRLVPRQLLLPQLLPHCRGRPAHQSLAAATVPLLPLPLELALAPMRRPALTSLLSFSAWLWDWDWPMPTLMPTLMRTRRLRPALDLLLRRLLLVLLFRHMGPPGLLGVAAGPEWPLAMTVLRAAIMTPTLSMTVTMTVTMTTPARVMAATMMTLPLHEAAAEGAATAVAEGADEEEGEGEGRYQEKQLSAAAA